RPRRGWPPASAGTSERTAYRRSRDGTTARPGVINSGGGGRYSDAAMFALLLRVALLGAPSAPDELQQRLAELASPDGQRREAAQRWLAAHMEPARYPELAEAALAGDAEVRLRLARALSDDARHLGLALLFMNDADPGLRALGVDAAGACIARFD